MIRKFMVLFVILFISFRLYGDTKLTESNYLWGLDWSPDGTKILFSTSKNNNCLNLATISPSGTNETVITSEEGAEIAALFHSDGSIYYLWANEIGTDLRKMNSDGSSKTTLLTIPANYDVEDMRISTVTAKIGYVGTDIYTGETKLWIANLDGTNNNQLTNASPYEWGNMDFSADGQWIVFSSSTDYLYKIKIDNSGLTQLTTFYAYAPDCSPDGSKIAFGSNGEIWTINSDGSGLTNITGDGYTTSDTEPKWSPDGSKILWQTGDSACLWVMNYNGSNKIQLSASVWWSCYAWNKTGSKIAFSNGQNISTINPDGTGVQQITNNSNPIFHTSSDFNDTGIVWSGDYEKIACVRLFPLEYRLSIMNKDGSGKYDLVTSTSEINSVSFTPHTTKILYMKGYGIYTINTDGSNETFLTNGDDADLVWSNNKTKIAYTTYTGNKQYLAIMNSDGTNQINLTTGTSFACCWSSDDTKIVFESDDDIYTVMTSSPYTMSQITTDGQTNREHVCVFSPDNTKIAYTVSASGGDLDDLWVMNADGTGKLKLANKLPEDSRIKWAANDRIYFMKTVGSMFYQVWSIRKDGTDARRESQVCTIVGSFDVSSTGEVIYSGLDIFRTGATSASYYIKGYIKDSGGTGIIGTTITLSGSGTYTTSSNGYYEFTGLASGNYTVTPSKTDYTFSPTNRSYSPLAANQDNQDFTGTYSTSTTQTVISVSATSLDFGKVKKGESKTQTFTITNIGGGTLSGAVESNQSWIQVSPSTFTANSQTISVTVNNAILNQSKGQYSGTISITSNGGNSSVPVSVTATCVLTKPNPYNPNGGQKLKFFGSGIVPNDTKIRIFTVSGKPVKTLNETLGQNEVEWDGRNDDGEEVVNGIYLYVSESPTEKSHGKFTVVKK